LPGPRSPAPHPSVPPGRSARPSGAGTPHQDHLDCTRHMITDHHHDGRRSRKPSQNPVGRSTLTPLARRRDVAPAGAAGVFSPSGGGGSVLGAGPGSGWSEVPVPGSELRPPRWCTDRP
jgi:hypothetical protein